MVMFLDIRVFFNQTSVRHLTLLLVRASDKLMKCGLGGETLRQVLKCSLMAGPRGWWETVREASNCTPGVSTVSTSVQHFN